MKVVLIYFTGTYNTLYLTTLLKNLLIKRGHQVEVKELLSLNKNSKLDCDLIGIGYPIHAFNAPKIVEKKIKELRIVNQKVFIYKNSGEPLSLNNASSYHLFQLLKKNQFYGEYHFLMPYNILFKTDEAMVNLFYQYNLKYLNYMCDHFSPCTYKVKLYQRFITWIFKIQRLGCKINAHFYKVDKRKCIRCRKCYTSCPTNNIKYDKKKRKLVFHNQCVMCMRCSFTCPTDAIKIGLLNKYKVNGPYDRLKITTTDYGTQANELLNTSSFYKKFKKYFEHLDQLFNS